MRRAASFRPPPGFSLWSEADLRVLTADGIRAAVRNAGLHEPRRIQEALAHRAGEWGRGPTAIVSLPGQAEPLVLRRVLHGGLLGPLLRGGLAGPGRPLRELAATAALWQGGAPVPQPAFAAAWRTRARLWSAVVGTYYISDSVDGVALLESPIERRRIESACAAAGNAIRRFHDAGGRHPDLHVKNLLFVPLPSPTAFRAYVIDLDRARCDTPPDPSTRMRELMRLYRSLRKRNLLHRVGVRGCAALWHAYLGGDRALRRALWRHRHQERLRVAVHALRYTIRSPTAWSSGRTAR